jgi:GNAT superfamily N-acetyltransferase
VKVVAVSNTKGEITDVPRFNEAEPIHQQLRPQIPDYQRRMREVLASGAEMAVALVDGKVAGVAVFRILEKTFSGREIYCDDLVTDEARRSTGVGRALTQYMEALGRERGCNTFALDSGCQRRQAHKFYFREGMAISSFRFDKTLS